MASRFEVRVQPGAGRDELGPWRDGRLIVRVTAPALEGRANKAVCKLLAKRLGVAPSRITVVRGEQARIKLIEVDGISEDELRKLAATE